MAAPQDAASLPDVPLVLQGQTFQMRFGVRALLALKRHWKLESQEEVQAAIASKSRDLETMVDVIWAALQTHHRDMTNEDVLDLIDGEDLGIAAERLAEAMKAAGPPEPKARPQ